MASKKVDLSESYRDGDEVYGPGEDVEVSERVYELLKARGAFEEEATPPEEGEPVEVLASVDPGLASELKALGFGTVEAVQKAKDADLRKANSVDAQKVKEIREELKARQATAS